MKRMKMRICAMLIVLLTLAAAHGVAATVLKMGDVVSLTPKVYDYYHDAGSPDNGSFQIPYQWLTDKGSSVGYESSSNKKYKLIALKYDMRNAVLAPAYSDVKFDLEVSVGAERNSNKWAKGSLYVGIGKVFSSDRGTILWTTGRDTTDLKAYTSSRDTVITKTHTFTNNWIENREGASSAFPHHGDDTYVASTFAEMMHTILQDFSIQLAGSGSNYAKVKVKDVINYIYYDENGAPEGTAPAMQTKKGNKSITLSSQKLTRSGYEHVGWNTQENGKGKHYNFGATYSGTSGVKLYAEWINNDTLTFNFNGGRRKSDNITSYTCTVTSGSGNFNDISWLKPERDGYEFEGWYTASENGTMVYGADGKCNNASAYWENSLWTGNSDMTLYARWRRFCKVTLDKQGGSGGTNAYWYKYNVDEKITIKGTTFTIYYYDGPDCTENDRHILDRNDSQSTYMFSVPSKSGCDFQGYFTEPNGRGTQYMDKSGMGINNIYKVFNRDVTLYAYWTEKAAVVPTITTQPQSATLTYGTQNSLTLSVTAEAAGATLSYQWKENGANIPGATGRTYTITPLPAGSNEYVCVVTSTAYGKRATRDSDVAKVVVNKANPSITWPTVRSTIYMNDELTYSGGSNVTPGAFAFTGPTMWSDAGSHTTQLTFTPEDTNNYNVLTQAKTVTVSKRNVQSVQTLADITAEYGTLLTELGLPTAIEVTVDGPKTYAVPVTWSAYDRTKVGTQTLTATLDNMFDHEVEQPISQRTVSVRVTLTEKMPEIAFWGTKTVTYSGQGVRHEIDLNNTEGIASATYTYQKMTVLSGTEETVEYTDIVGLPKDAGSYLVTAVLTGKSGDEYLDNIPVQHSELEITKKPLVVEANDHTIIYGDAPANGGVSCDGFVSGEDASDLGALTYSYSYAQNGNVGTYTITPSAASGNYEITCKSGTLTVNSKEIGIAWSNLKQVYTGQPLKPTATATATDVVNGDMLDLTVAGAQVNAGEYTATVTGITGAKASNYKLPADVEEKFEIIKKGLTVTANNHTITYGEAPANNGVRYDGFVSGEDASNLGAITYSYSYAQYGDVGTYTITPSSTAENYAITFNPGTLTVNQKEIGIVWSNQEQTYTGQKLKPTATATGAVNSDVLGLTVAGEQSKAGKYTATVTAITGEKAGNYKLPADVEEEFEIIKKGLTVTTNDHTITYGQAPANNGVRYDGFVSGEDASNLGAITYSYSYAQYGDVGTYTITPSAAAENYAITFNPGTLTVNQKEIGIVWGNPEHIYNGQPFKPTATATGAVNSDVLGLTVAGEKTDVGQYTATVTAITGAKAGNYKLPSGVTTTFRIKNAEQSAPVVTGVNETISLKCDGMITGVNEAMEWRVKGTGSFARVETGKRIIENLAAGTYEVRYAEKANYNASPVTEITIAAGRKLKLTVPASQVGYSLEAKLGSGSFTKNAIEFDWNDDFELQFTLGAGYSLLNGAAITDANDSSRVIALTADTQTVPLADVQADVQLEVTGVADITPPEVSISIVVEPTVISRMMKSLSFDDYYKENLVVTITAQDAGSGVKSIEYSVKNQETDHARIKDWAPYTSPLKLDKDNPYVIYARVTDHANNETYYNSQRGVVIDKTPPTVQVIQNGSDCEIKVPDDSKDKPEYYGDTQFRVTDTNLDYVLLDGERVTLNQDGCFTITADNKLHEIVAWDKARNSTTYEVWIYKIYTVIFIADGTEVHSVQVNHGWDTPMIDVPHSYGEGEKLAYWDHDGKNITKDTTITAVYFNGELKDVTVPQENFGGAVIENTLEELLAAVPVSTEGDPSEQFMIDHGADLKVWIATTDITENVPEQDRKLLEEMAKKIGSNNHIYLDISMFKQVGSRPEVKITRLNRPIKLTQSVPQMRLISSGNHVRTYHLVRIHEGVAQEIPMTFDPETAMLTFETDRFSTYALLWNDTFIPSTGDRSNLMLSLAMLLVSCALLLGVRKKTGKAV